ncbi:TB2/DP1, HVA22 family-domain-containing protein [Lactifluus subvellereus]|nr:TB2/DP1, HVA22 family-domain-containing protein [Lactifluus subvellereus]
MFIVSRLLAGWFTFLLPSYSTFKALRQRPLDVREIERWASYWTVIGALVAFEYTAEWLLSWLPFYWEIKTALLLFLSLPQFEARLDLRLQDVPGTVSRPKRGDIDAGIASARDETVQFLQSRLSALWDILYSLLNKTPVAPKRSPGGTLTNGSPVAGGQKALQSAQGLWGAISPPSFAPSAPTPNSRPAISRSTSATSVPAPEKHAPFFASPSSVAVSGGGYDIGETISG